MPLPVKIRSVLFVAMDRPTPVVVPEVQAWFAVPEVSNEAVEPAGGKNSYRSTVKKDVPEAGETLTVMLV